MPLFDHFGLVAPFYERFIPLRNIQKLEELIGSPSSGLILDAGGGTGRVSKALQSLDRRIIIADLSLGMLKQVGRVSGLTTVCAQTEKLPFPSATFDRVIMVDALHHVYHQKETIEELWRLVSIGGRIIIEEPDIRNFSVKVVALLEKLALMRSHFLSPPEIINLFPGTSPQCKVVLDGFNAWVIVDKPA